MNVHTTILPIDLERSLATLQSAAILQTERLKRLESAADLTRKIDTIEADLAKSTGPSARTPAGGMQRLERARKANAVVKLKNKRTKLAKAKK